MDLLGGGRIGDGDHVIADLGDADGSVLGVNVVDGVAVVGFARGGLRGKPIVKAPAGDPADQDHGVGDGAVGAVGVGHAMDGDGDLVDVAFPVDAGGVNELLVIGGAIERLEVVVEDGVDGAQIDVNDAVGLGQKASGLGRGLGAQEDGHGQQSRTAATMRSVLRVRRFMPTAQGEPSGMSVASLGGAR